MASSILPSRNIQNISENALDGNTMFIPTMLANKPTIPKQFFWPKSETAPATGILDAPTIDLQAVLTGDTSSIKKQIDALRAACETHGFFLVVNHGIDTNILNGAMDRTAEFFTMPLETKLNMVKKKGSMSGYSGAHSERFLDKLPWKESLSFKSGGGIEEFMGSSIGKEFEPMGLVYQKYSEAMKKLSLSIMELLGLSLDVGRDYYRDFFQDCGSIMRCNYYPRCPEPELTLGTGPHSDTVALTILQQEEAMTNGMYKSCVHRAVVNRHSSRRSIAFFVIPRGDKVIRAHDSLIGPNGKRLYPDFTWSELEEFTQKYHRADENTLQCFAQRLLRSSSSE
ncbi:gibberellin 20 oxidase 2-like protein [Carex littledalei]|uniref:Gibberellin 20 oxidase 2-like protein n=1 Tax=Carex littledalei TaxID=544730 RepID=A0A833R2N6_9POAL|nr:gibberellin 20 oxidase 2-like protein [Carex littledalei]